MAGTLTTLISAHNIAVMEYSVSPIGEEAVKVKCGKVLPNLSMEELSQSDPSVICTIEGDVEHVIAGCGGLHVANRLGDCWLDVADTWRP